MILIEDNFDDTSPENQGRLARDLLLRGLQEGFGIKEMPEWGYGEFGKPFFKDYPNIHFNLSHCVRAVSCYISDRPAGIDVETVMEYDDDLARYISSPLEYEGIIRSERPDIAFTSLWTKKESYCKLTGIGLTDREAIRNILTGNDCDFKTIINEAKGYVLTSCSYPLP